jgi:hypothetical protein
MRQIATVKPKALVALGATAAKNLLALNAPMSELRGRWYDFKPAAKRSVMAGRAPCRHLPSGVFAPRSTTKGGGVEGFADGDEVPGHRAPKKAAE